jgi:hypothetical protein
MHRISRGRMTVQAPEVALPVGAAEPVERFAFARLARICGGVA